jgi:predicted phage terminase large subunit-like protein
MVRLTTDDALEAERIMCGRSLGYFVKRAWRHIIPDDLQWNWHLDAICEHLEAVQRGEITRLLVNVPPGSSKSTLIGIMYPAWLWGPGGDPGHRYIGAAHEQGLAVRDNRIMRELVKTEWYQRLWPLAIKGDQNEKLYFENEHRGFRQACAVKSMTGRRGHTIAWDDPLSPEKAHSPAGREEAIRVLSETVPTRLNDPARSAIIVVMQRLHEMDPSGFILSEGLGYDHLCIPMEYEPGNATTSIGWTDPRKQAGDLMFPDRFPADVVERDKRAMGSYAWAGQMQQRPAPVGGGIFKDEWWPDPVAIPPAMSHRVIYGDTAQKTGQANDYSVFQCWGAGQKGELILLDMIRGKWEAPELLLRARAFYAKHKDLHPSAPLRAMKVEDKVSGTGLIQTLRREGIPVLGIKRNTDKVTRAMDAAPFIESGNVLLTSDCPHLSDFLAEASAFPNGAHDDTIDPMMDAVYELISGRNAAAKVVLRL